MREHVMCVCTYMCVCVRVCICGFLYVPQLRELVLSLHHMGPGSEFRMSGKSALTW